MGSIRLRESSGFTQLDDQAAYARLASVGRRAQRRAFFPLQQPWLPRRTEMCRAIFRGQNGVRIFLKKKVWKESEGGMKGVEFFQICYFATNLDVLSWCFRVFYDFCFQFEIDHPPPFL